MADDHGVSLSQGVVIRGPDVQPAQQNCDGRRTVYAQTAWIVFLRPVDSTCAVTQILTPARPDVSSAPVRTGRTIVINKSHAINDDWLIHIGRREPNSISFLQCHGDRVTPHGMRELFRQCSESLNVRKTGLFREILLCEVVAESENISQNSFFRSWRKDSLLRAAKFEGK